MKLGVVANEFFDLRLGRMGGFGWAARQVAECFGERPALGVDVVFMTREPLAFASNGGTAVHRTRLLACQRSLADVLRVRRERCDLLLLIDYRPNYRFFTRALPRTPFIVWVRDPRPPEDDDKIATLRIPGAEAVRPQGIRPIDCTSLAGVVRVSRWMGRRCLLASPAPHLADKVPGTYGMRSDTLFFLPNIVAFDPGRVTKSERPRVVFLARLDPYKRPWVFVELARRFPDVEFLLLGQAHFHGEGAWRPALLPANVRSLGHVGEDDKIRLLSSAWVSVNTSIHEGLATSFLEALACETPLLTCQDPGGIASRFGVFAGRFDGTGLDALPALAAGLESLLRDPERRRRLGREGREWVTATHGREQFVDAFHALSARLGVTA